MSSVRESVEWSFGLIKGLWGYINFDKKMKVRQYPVGKFYAFLDGSQHDQLM